MLVIDLVEVLNKGPICNLFLSIESKVVLDNIIYENPS